MPKKLHRDEFFCCWPLAFGFWQHDEKGMASFLLKLPAANRFSFLFQTEKIRNLQKLSFGFFGYIRLETIRP